MNSVDVLQYYCFKLSYIVWNAVHSFFLHMSDECLFARNIAFSQEAE